MASLSNRVSSFFLINNSLKWWLFQCFFRPFTVSILHNLEKKRKEKDRLDPTEPNPTRDPYFSGWVGFLPDKLDCYRVGLRVAVKSTRPNPILVLNTRTFNYKYLCVCIYIYIYIFIRERKIICH